MGGFPVLSLFIEEGPTHPLSPCHLCALLCHNSIGKMFGEEQRRPHAAADFKDDHRNRDGPDREGLLEVKLLRYGKDDATSSTSKTVAEAAASTPRNDEGDDRKQNDRHRWNTSPERYGEI